MVTPGENTKKFLSQTHTHPKKEKHVGQTKKKSHRKLHPERTLSCVTIPYLTNGQISERAWQVMGGVRPSAPPPPFSPADRQAELGGRSGASFGIRAELPAPFPGPSGPPPFLCHHVHSGVSSR